MLDNTKESERRGFSLVSPTPTSLVKDQSIWNKNQTETLPSCPEKPTGI